MNANRILIAAIVLLAGCSTVQTVTEADTMIGGRAYRDQPIDLGRVKMMVTLQPQVKEGEKFVTDPEHVEIVIGFLTGGEATSVVAHSGTLVSRKDGKAAELVARFQARGNDARCLAETVGELTTDYWFNGRAGAEAWKCALLRFRLPGHQPTDPLDLNLEPVNVGGELVRVLPVTFVFRTTQAGEEPAAKAPADAQ
jgi:hypothetical protein